MRGPPRLRRGGGAGGITPLLGTRASIWGETESPVGIYGGSRKFRLLGGSLIVKILKKFDLKLMRDITFDPKRRELGQDWPIKAHTMIGLRRLSNIQECGRLVIEDNIPGDFIETGVWRGGGCIFMQGILEAYKETEFRRVWVADSFEGLPSNNTALYPEDTIDWSSMGHTLAVSLEDVKGNFKKYGLLDVNVHFLKG